MNTVEVTTLESAGGQAAIRAVQAKSQLLERFFLTWGQLQHFLAFAEYIIILNRYGTTQLLPGQRLWHCNPPDAPTSLGAVQVQTRRDRAFTLT